MNSKVTREAFEGELEENAHVPPAEDDCCLGTDTDMNDAMPTARPRKSAEAIDLKERVLHKALIVTEQEA